MPNQQGFAFGGELLPFDGSAVLYPDFFDDAIAEACLSELATGLAWEQHELVMFGRRIPEPRFSCWYADDDRTYTYSGIRRTAHPFTNELSRIRTQCEEISSHTFNGVLANLYRNGADHMGWHSDNEPVNGPEPVIASVSLGSERRFDFKHRTTGEKVSTMLPHGSLLVMSGKSQSHWLHRIAKSTKVAEPRINLTFRHLYDVT
jgi:alkylated DNA repair dioxygenase AlkB